MKTLRTAIIIYIIVILLTACGGNAPADQSAQLEGPTWILTAINKGTPIQGTAPTIEFADGQVSGNASCNSFGGSYELDGDSISFGAMFMTEMYCMDPEGAMDQEMLYLDMLGKAQRFEINEGVLTIIIAAQESLTFQQQVAN